jgi:hypothetical protein
MHLGPRSGGEAHLHGRARQINSSFDAVDQLMSVLFAARECTGTARKLCTWETLTALVEQE